MRCVCLNQRCAAMPLRRALLLLAALLATLPSPALTQTGAWSSGQLASFLAGDEVSLPSVAAAAAAAGLDGAAALALDKAGWRELGASGLQAAKLKARFLKASLLEPPPPSLVEPPAHRAAAAQQQQQPMEPFPANVTPQASYRCV